jgi:hypothetical protein
MLTHISSHPLLLLKPNYSTFDDAILDRRPHLYQTGAVTGNKFE